MMMVVVVETHDSGRCCPFLLLTHQTRLLLLFFKSKKNPVRTLICSASIVSASAAQTPKHPDGDRLGSAVKSH